MMCLSKGSVLWIKIKVSKIIASPGQDSALQFLPEVFWDVVNEYISLSEVECCQQDLLLAIQVDVRDVNVKRLSDARVNHQSDELQAISSVSCFSAIHREDEEMI